MSPLSSHSSQTPCWWLYASWRSTLLPRWNADSNFMTAVAEVRVLPEALGDTWRKLRAAWPAPGAG